MNAEANLTENYRIDENFPFMPAKPINDFRVRLWLGCFAKDVGVNKVSHKVSVDSEGMGTK